MTVQYLVNGLTMGLIYALIAVGYSLVFGILKMINMAHGAIYAVGAHMILLFVTWNLGTLPAVILSIVFTGGLLVVYDRSILATLRKKKAPGIAALVTTIGFPRSSPMLFRSFSVLRSNPSRLCSETR